VNAYEVRQAWCLLQVKLCDPCLSALKWFVYHARRYTSARLYFYFTVLRRSRSSEVTEFGTNRKRICDFLLVINTNLDFILHRFRDNSVRQVQNRYTPLVFNSPDGRVPL